MNAELYSFSHIRLLNQTTIWVKESTNTRPQEFRDSAGDETILRADEPATAHIRTKLYYHFQKFGNALFTRNSGSMRETGSQQALKKNKNDRNLNTLWILFSTWHCTRANPVCYINHNDSWVSNINQYQVTIVLPCIS